MEREGEVGRGRREVRGRGIIIGGVIIGLLLGCNNGEIEKLEKRNQFLTSISNLGKGFLSVFTDLGNMVTGAFGIKAETKKDDIGGKYFTKIADTMGAVKQKLQDEVVKNGNYEKVKKVVDKFIADVLEEIASGAKEVSEVAKGTEFLGNMTASHGGEVKLGRLMN